MITCNIYIIYIYIYITPGQALRFLGPLNVHGAQSILGSFGQSDIIFIIPTRNFGLLAMTL